MDPYERKASRTEYMRDYRRQQHDRESREEANARRAAETRQRQRTRRTEYMRDYRKQLRNRETTEEAKERRAVETQRCRLRRQAQLELESEEEANLRRQRDALRKRMRKHNRSRKILEFTEGSQPSLLVASPRFPAVQTNDHMDIVKHECCKAYEESRSLLPTVFKTEKGNDELPGVDGISASSYSASINLAGQETWLPKPEPFGFTEVDVECFPPPEPSPPPPDVDPLQLTTDDPAPGRHLTFSSNDVKREPEDVDPTQVSGGPGESAGSSDQDMVASVEDSNHNTFLNELPRIKCEDEDFKVEPCENSRDYSEDDISSESRKGESRDCHERQATFSCDRYVSQQTITNTSELTYSCDVCQSEFSAESHLGDHMKVHCVEKPYTFVVCDAGVSHQYTLFGQIEKHKGEKMYSCNICLSKFSQIGHLNTHVRTHTTE